MQCGLVSLIKQKGGEVQIMVFRRDILYLLTIKAGDNAITYLSVNHTLLQWVSENISSVRKYI